MAQTIADPTRAGHHGSEAQIDQVNQWMRSTPWYQAQLAQWGQTGAVKLSSAQRDQLMALARSNGIDITKDTEIDPAGNLNPKGHKLRNTIIIAGIAAGGYYAAPYIAGALGGSGAAGAGAASAGGAGVGIGETAAVTGLAGSGFGAAAGAGAGGAAAGGVGAAVGKGLGSIGWSNLIGAGTSLAGAALQSRAVGKGAELEAQGQREALDFLKERDKRDYADQAPYRALGAGAAGSLGHYLGFPAPPAAYDPNTPQGPIQAPIPAAPGVNVGDPRLGDGQPVTMVAPDGEEKAVPASQVQHWLSKGASIKPTAGASTNAPASVPMGAPSLNDLLQRRTA